jgi:hypothetical protein
MFGKTNTRQDKEGAAMHYGAWTKVIFHCLSSHVGALMKVKLIVDK